MSEDTTGKININASVDQAGQLSVRIVQQSKILGLFQEIILNQAQVQVLAKHLDELIVENCE